KTIRGQSQKEKANKVKNQKQAALNMCNLVFLLLLLYVFVKSCFGLCRTPPCILYLGWAPF
uniref:Uncharacterized protein n=1 Tax=Oryza brachyantha TaxID=4533 RepID=J3MQ03_ORYBR